MATTRPAETRSSLAVVTSWLPVTSHPYQEGCSSAIWAVNGLGPGNQGYVFDIPYGLIVNTSLKCQPEAFSAIWLSEYYKVGGSLTTWKAGPLTCPEAYETMTTSVVNSQTTSIFCGPKSYALQPGFDVNICTSSITSGQVLTYAVHNPFIDASAITFIPPFPDITKQAVFTTTTLSSNTYVRGFGLNGYIFNDNSGTQPTTPPSVTSSAISNKPSSSSGTSSTALNVIPTQASSGLSSSAKTGIGVGVSIGVLAIMSLVLLWAFWRRRNRTVGNLRGNNSGAHEKDGRAIFTKPAELDWRTRAQEPAELHGRPGRGVLEGPQELQ
ncbi:hypothetical protein B0J14DRAFT_662169 [Halenospora varia]|nr:hypothetical protein B0J14DRAFT_662169 [Halenospora varia]